MTLDDAKDGCKYRVECLEHNSCLKMRMLSLGLVPGEEITCCQNNWCGIIVDCKGCKLAMRKTEAEKIVVSPMGFIP